MQRPGKLSRSISQQALLQIEIECRAVVTQCLRKYSLLELVNGELECSCCRDDKSVAGITTKPQYQFKINQRVSFSVSRHWQKSKTHFTCARAREKFNQRKDFYNHSFQLARDEAKIMTENVFRAVYFLLRHDLSINLFEAIIELLDNCNTLKGNQQPTSRNYNR